MGFGPDSPHADLSHQGQDVAEIAGLKAGVLHHLQQPSAAATSCARARAIASVLASSAVHGGDFRRIVDDYDKAINVQLTDPKRYKAVQDEPDSLPG